MSDADTERLMLEAGARFASQQGLSLSFEHLSMEELIADAGVSRTSSYRRWPTKDAFAADLLLHIAENTRLTADFAPYSAAISAVVAPLIEGLDSEQGRRDLLVEIFRAITDADFAASLGSESWRNYLVLRAAQGGLPEGELRSRVSAALRQTERGFNAYRAGALAAASGLMGFRLGDPASIDWATLAEFLSAAFTGLMVRAFADPESVLTERLCAPFGSSRQAPWTLATLTSGQLFFAATEPDPGVVWDAERVALVRAQLADLDGTLGVLWAGASGSG